MAAVDASVVFIYYFDLRGVSRGDNEQGHRGIPSSMVFFEYLLFVNDLYATRAWSPLSRSTAIIPCKNG